MANYGLKILVMAALVGGALVQTRAEETSPAGALGEQLAAMKDTRTLEAHFVCEKKLAMLDTPLLSEGRLWIKQGDPHDGEGAVRFSTDKPYVSELILVGGKVLARSQHETEWTKTNQSGRPGLTAVMAELGGWSTGGIGKLADEYAITNGTGEVPATPAEGQEQEENGKKTGKDEVAMFVLKPVNKDLLKAVKSVTVGIDRATHHLRYLEILTQQDDATRYWFYDVKTNASLPADIFGPSQAPAASQPKRGKP